MHSTFFRIFSLHFEQPQTFWGHIIVPNPISSLIYKTYWRRCTFSVFICCHKYIPVTKCPKYTFWENLNIFKIFYGLWFWNFRPFNQYFLVKIIDKRVWNSKIKDLWPLSNTYKILFSFSISLRYMQKVLKTCGWLGSNVAHPKYSKPTSKRHYSIWSSMVAIQYSYIL